MFSDWSASDLWFSLIHVTFLNLKGLQWISALERFLLFIVVTKPWKHRVKVFECWKAYKRNTLTQIQCLFLASLSTFPHRRLALLFLSHSKGTAWCTAMQNSLLHQPHLCSNGGTGLQFLLSFDMLVDGPKKKIIHQNLCIVKDNCESKDRTECFAC